jgi:spermidine synthase
VLRASLILIGFTAVTAQTVAMRELMAVYYGNEIALGLMLAAWLLWTALGSSIGGRFAGRARRPRLAMALCQIAAAAALPLAIAAIRASRAWFGGAPGEILGPGSMLAATLATLGPFCAASGCLFAAGTRLYAREHAAETAQSAAAVYLLEAIGSGIGGIFAGVLLIRFLSAFEIALLLAWLNVVAAAALLRAPRLALAAIALAAALIPAAAARLESASTARLWSGFRLAGTANSIYGSIAVTAGEGGTGTVFENGLALFHVPDAAAAEEAVHYALLQHPAPRTLLLAGGGFNGSLAQALQHRTLERIDYVELDPAIPALAARHFPGAWDALRADPRVRIHYADARLFVKTAPTAWDVIILNLPDPQTAQLNRFYTVEFFRETARHLAPGGVLSFRLSASENYIGPELAAFLRSINKTLRAVFPEVEVMPGDSVHFFASMRPLAATSDALLARLRERNLRTEYVREYYIPFRLTPDRIQELETLIRPVPGTPLNRDFAPIAYYFDVALWGAHYGARWRRAFDRLAAVPFPALLAAVLPLFLFGLAKPAARTGFAVAAMGWTSIGLEMLLLLGFQAIYGYVYSQLALLVAAFLAGGALGSWLALRRNARALAPVQLAAALAPLALFAVFELLARTAGSLAPALFPLLALLCGALGGWQFPAASRAFFGAGKTGNPGALYALDLLGACCAALVFSTWLIPVYGFLNTALLTAAINVPALLAVLPRGLRTPAR